MSMAQPPEDGNNDAGKNPNIRVVFTSDKGRIEDGVPSYRANVYDDWSAEPTERTWLIEGLIPDNRLTLLVGEGGLGKSTIALQIAIAIAAGDEDVLPGTELPYKHGKNSVVYMAFEEEQEEELRRIHRLGGKSVIEEIGNRLVYMDGAAEGEIWRPDSHGSGHTSTAGEATVAMHNVKAVCEERDARLVIIDTVGHAFMSNENDRGIVNEFLRHLDHWARQHRIAVMLVAHPPKSGARYSGNSTWRGTVRALLSLEMAPLIPPARPGEEGIKSPALVLDKSNYGIPRHKFPIWWLACNPDGSYPEGKIRMLSKDAAKAMVAGNPEPRGNEGGDGIYKDRWEI